jgi:hypothetical protein
MYNRLDAEIAAYVQDQCDAALKALQAVFMVEKLLVPVSEPAKELEPGRYDVPVVCMRTEAGAGAIPVFTAMEDLFKWSLKGVCTPAAR